MVPPEKLVPGSRIALVAPSRWTTVDQVSQWEEMIGSFLDVELVFEDSLATYRSLDEKGDRLLAGGISLIGASVWMNQNAGMTAKELIPFFVCVSVSLWHAAQCRLPGRRSTALYGCETIRLVNESGGSAEYWAAFALDHASEAMEESQSWKASQVRASFLWLAVSVICIVAAKFI